MQTPHQCSGCVSRRRCLQIITTAAAGLAFSGEFFPALAKARKADPAFVDPSKFRPRPKIRVDAAILEQPRPYWLGWPGKTYLLDQRQKEYRAQLAGSCQRLGIELHEEDEPIEDRARDGGLPQGGPESASPMACWSSSST